jgi:hypothetical protein
LTGQSTTAAKRAHGVDAMHGRWFKRAAAVLALVSVRGGGGDDDDSGGGTGGGEDADALPRRLGGPRPRHRFAASA